MLAACPKENAWRSRPYRMLVASFACEHCAYAGGQQAAHADLGKGGGIKADDRTCWSGCAPRPGRIGCHALLGSTGYFTRDQRRALELRYACRTIVNLQRLGLWGQFNVALPPWFDRSLA